MWNNRLGYGLYPRTWWVLGAVLGLLVACQSPELELPVAEDQLVELLADLHLAENASQELPAESKDQIKPKYYDRAFKDRGISREDFELTIKILNQDPARLTKIYTQVHEVLVSREAESKAEVKQK